jgi:hypothetical protein
MVAFAALIVISKDAFSRDDKSKPVFEGMCAARNRFRQMLQNNLEKRIVADGPAGLLNEDGLHVVICNNTPWLSMETTLLANPVSVPRDNGCRYARREVPYRSARFPGRFLLSTRSPRSRSEVQDDSF